MPVYSGKQVGCRLVPIKRENTVGCGLAHTVYYVSVGINIFVDIL